VKPGDEFILTKCSGQEVVKEDKFEANELAIFVGDTKMILHHTLSH
jgi:hypothetical protein